MDLYNQLSTKIHMADSEIIPELWKMLADETDAKILLAMPGQAETLAEKLAIPLEQLEARAKELFRRGVLFKSKKTTPPTYKMSRDIIQFHDASALWPEAPIEFLDLWQKWYETEWVEMAHGIAKHQTIEGSRLIPIHASIEAKTTVLNFENISDIVKNARSLAVTKCTCRTHAKKCVRPLETCVQFNSGAEYAIERGTGRKITAEEAMEIFQISAEAGLVPLTTNQRDVATMVCNCCPCCCQSLPLLINNGLPMTAPTRYRAEINADLCNGCGVCHERCHFGAIKWESENISGVNAEKCMGCGLCQITCPAEAINMTEARAEDFVPLKFTHPSLNNHG